jgi:hypothetical protein
MTYSMVTEDDDDDDEEENVTDAFRQKICRLL